MSRVQADNASRKLSRSLFSQLPGSCLSEFAFSFDGDFEAVSCFYLPESNRCSGHDHVSREQRKSVRYGGDQFVDVVNHEHCSGVLRSWPWNWP